MKNNSPNQASVKYWPSTDGQVSDRLPTDYEEWTEKWIEPKQNYQLFPWKSDKTLQVQILHEIGTRLKVENMMQKNEV